MWGYMMEAAERSVLEGWDQEGNAGDWFMIIGIIILVARGVGVMTLLLFPGKVGRVKQYI